MDETTKTEGSTTINQYPNNNGWGGPWGGGWGGYGYPVAVPAYGYGNGFGGGFGDLMRGFGGNINIGRGGNALGVVVTVLGAVSLGGVSLGTGGCSLLLGLACGCVNRRRPALGHLPGSALALLRSLGLNLFIAALALGAEVSPSALFGSAALRLALAAAAIALVPLAGALAFGRFVLRLPPVPLLGALCGAATCTPALYALEEETGSSAFTAAYTLPYVFSNILLTILGSTVPRLLVAAPGPF